MFYNVVLFVKDVENWSAWLWYIVGYNPIHYKKACILP